MTENDILLKNGDNVREFINSNLEGFKFPDDPKSVLLVGFLSLSLDHHESVALLIRAKNTGSAFALLRPQLEIVFRAHWVIGCAAATQINQLYQDDFFKFPQMKQMASCIDTAFASDRFFMDWKQNSWKRLNSFAHPGHTALSRRFNGRECKPNYSESEIFEALRASNAYLILMGRFFFKVFNRPTQAKEIESFLPDHARAS